MNENDLSQQLQQMDNQQEFNQEVTLQDQQNYILLLQEKLQQFEAQLGKENQMNSQQEYNSVNFMASPTSNLQGSSKKTGVKCPTYPKDFDNWVIRQSISPSKCIPMNTYLRDSKNCTFQPEILKKSVKMSKREGAQSPEKYMVKYLYQDALQRFEKTKNKQRGINENILLESNKSKIGLKSQKIVLKKIEQTLNVILSDIQEDENFTFQNVGLYLEQLGVFKALRFKKTSNNETSLYLHDRQKIDLERLSKEMLLHEQLFKILSGNTDFVHKRVLFDATLVFLEKKLYVPYSAQLLHQILTQNNVQVVEGQVQNTQGTVIEEQEGDQSQQQQQNQDQDQGSSWNIEQLILEFRNLFEDKTQLMEWYANRKNILSTIDNQNELKFQPQICQKSKIIDKNNNGDKKRYDLLFEHSKYLLEKKIETKEKFDNEEIEKCTFQPYTNDYNFPEFSDVSQNRFEKLYNLGEKKLVKNSQKKAALDQYRLQQEVQECTFKPQKLSNIPQRSVQDKSFREEVKGSQEVVRRYQKARDEKEYVDGYWDRKRDTWLQHDTTKITETLPFSLSNQTRSTKKDKGDLLGTVDVNYAKGKKAKIAIYRGDSAAYSAKNFAKIHGLSDNMTECLKEMLENYIKGFDQDQDNSQNQISNYSPTIENRDQENQEQQELNQQIDQDQQQQQIQEQQQYQQIQEPELFNNNDENLQDAEQEAQYQAQQQQFQQQDEGEGEDYQQNEQQEV